MMLMRVKNTRDIRIAQAALRQPLADSQSGYTGINQDVGTAAGNNSRISAAAAGEHRKPDHGSGATGFNFTSSGESALAGLP